MATSHFRVHLTVKEREKPKFLKTLVHHKARLVPVQIFIFKSLMSHRKYIPYLITQAVRSRLVSGRDVYKLHSPIAEGPKQIPGKHPRGFVRERKEGDVSP